jgi:hypothetical protein
MAPEPTRPPIPRDLAVLVERELAGDLDDVAYLGCRGVRRVGLRPGRQLHAALGETACGSR